MDIVERLRSPLWGTETSERLLMQRAADQIELLAIGLDDASKKCGKLEDEIEQLREALAFYAEWGIDAPAVDAIIEEDRGDKARAALNIVLGEEE